MCEPGSERMWEWATSGPWEASRDQVLVQSHEPWEREEDRD